MDQVPQESLFNSKHVSSEAQHMLETFWLREMDAVQNMAQNDFRTQELPLARIKKIMKLDEDVKMISGEAPVLFAKAVEMFISELSLRAWVNTEDNKRRTLQRNDIAMAISKYDQFDFLIDIVPREEAKPPKRTETANTNVSQDSLNYFIQYAQQLQSSGQSVPIIQPSNQGQTFGVPQIFQVPIASSTNQGSDSSSLANSSIVQLSNTPNSQNTADKSNLGPIILSNVYNNGGEIIQQLPLSHYQTILQSQNSGQSQPIIINPQSLPVPTQYITNSGQLLQTILPSSSNMETQLETNKIVSQNENNGS